MCSLIYAKRRPRFIRRRPNKNKKKIPIIFLLLLLYTLLWFPTSEQTFSSHKMFAKPAIRGPIVVLIADDVEQTGYSVPCGMVPDLCSALGHYHRIKPVPVFNVKGIVAKFGLISKAEFWFREKLIVQEIQFYNKKENKIMTIINSNEEYLKWKKLLFIMKYCAYLIFIGSVFYLFRFFFVEMWKW